RPRSGRLAWSSPRPASVVPPATLLGQAGLLDVDGSILLVVLLVVIVAVVFAIVVIVIVVIVVPRLAAAVVIVVPGPPPAAAAVVVVAAVLVDVDALLDGDELLHGDDLADGGVEIVERLLDRVPRFGDVGAFRHVHLVLDVAAPTAALVAALVDLLDVHPRPALRAREVADVAVVADVVVHELAPDLRPVGRDLDLEV